MSLWLEGRSMTSRVSRKIRKLSNQNEGERA
jgi:hypothetical protein